MSQKGTNIGHSRVCFGDFYMKLMLLYISCQRTVLDSWTSWEIIHWHVKNLSVQLVCKVCFEVQCVLRGINILIFKHFIAINTNLALLLYPVFLLKYATII